MFALLIAVALSQPGTFGDRCTGKNCLVSSLTTLSQSPTGSICQKSASSNYSVLTGRLAQYWYVQRSGGLGTCTSSSATLMFADTVLNYVNVGGSGIWGNTGTYLNSDNGYSAPLALASFPTCNGTTLGRLLYDNTNSVWRFCDGSFWQAFATSDTASWTAYFPGLSTLLNLPFARYQHAGTTLVQGTSTVVIDNGVALVTGVGAGNAVFTIYDITAASLTSATLTVACTASVGSVTAGSGTYTLTAPGGAHTYEMRLTSNGCTTLPQLNVTVRFTASRPGN